MDLRQVQQGFSSFICQFFGIFDDFVKEAFLIKKIVKYEKYLAKTKQKPYSTSSIY